MAVKVGKNGEAILPVKNHLDGSNASSVGMYLDQAIDRGAKKILLDFSRVRHFEYFGLAVLMDILFQYKKSRRIEVGLHGLSPECLAVANHLGLERVLKS